MAIDHSSLRLLIVLYVSNVPLAFAQYENQFIYDGFSQAKLQLNGSAEILRNGLLKLTNFSKQCIGRAFYQFPIEFNKTSSLSFSTNFVFAIVPQVKDQGCHSVAFTISPSTEFKHTLANYYLGVFNASNNSLLGNHILAIEVDSDSNPELGEFDKNHVGIHVNGVKSMQPSPAMYFSNKEGKNISLDLKRGYPIQLWIDYDEAEKLLNVTLAPTKIPKPTRPLLSEPVNLSQVLLESMYVGIASATCNLAGDHYILGWSFNKSGPAKSLEVSDLPSLPGVGNRKEKPRVSIMTLIVAAPVVLTMITGAAYILKRKKFEEVREDWERAYGPQRFNYEGLHKATKGFKDTELLGAGGFGRVYRGRLPSSHVQIAVKRVSHDSKQGMKEFVAEIVSMGRLRHRNLVQLLGYCRRKGELLLVYDYMPNGSLDKHLYGNQNLKLNWLQRFQNIRGVASGLLYLHEEWEQVILHRDIKASNVLLDAEFNARLGDFGLAKLYNHGTNPQTTRVVGTLGYLAPEITRAGRATTCTDVYAFGTFMLEVACGRRPIEQQGPPEREILVDWVFECWRNGAILDAYDPRLEGNFVEDEIVLVLRVGLLCCQAMPSVRPSMRQVLQFLDGDAVLPELTKDRTSFFTFKTDQSPNFSPTQFSDPSISTLGSFPNSGR